MPKWPSADPGEEDTELRLGVLRGTQRCFVLTRRDIFRPVPRTSPGASGLGRGGARGTQGSSGSENEGAPRQARLALQPNPICRKVILPWHRVVERLGVEWNE